jgi:hypothetical protein
MASIPIQAWLIGNGTDYRPFQMQQASAAAAAILRERIRKVVPSRPFRVDLRQPVALHFGENYRQYRYRYKHG